MSNEKTVKDEKETHESPADEAVDATNPKKPAVRGKRLSTGIRGGADFDTGSSTCRWSCRVC